MKIVILMIMCINEIVIILILMWIIIMIWK